MSHILACCTGANRLWEEDRLQLDDEDDEATGGGWGSHVLLAKRLAVLLKSALRNLQSLPIIEEVLLYCLLRARHISC